MKILKLTRVEVGLDIGDTGHETVNYFMDNHSGTTAIGKASAYIDLLPPQKLVMQGLDIYPKFVIEWIEVE